MNKMYLLLLFLCSFVCCFGQAKPTKQQKTVNSPNHVLINDDTVAVRSWVRAEWGVSTGITTSDNNLTAAGLNVSTKKIVSALTDAPVIEWDMATGYNKNVTLGGNRTLNITNVQEGQYGTLKITQDGTGGRTITLPPNSKVIDGGAGGVTLTALPNAVDLLSFYYDGSSYYWTIGKNFN